MMRKIKYIGIILLVGVILLLSPVPGYASSSGGSGEKTSGKRFELPQEIRNYRFNAANEKKRLAEAISKLDELGFSPEKLLDHFWDFISRKENREKMGKAAENLKENAAKLLNKDGSNKSDTASESQGSAEDSVKDKLKKEADRQLEKVIDQAAEEVGDLASEGISRAAETAGDLAEEEISKAAEKVKEEVR